MNIEKHLENTTCLLCNCPQLDDGIHMLGDWVCDSCSFKCIWDYIERSVKNKVSRKINKSKRYIVLKRQKWNCNFCSKNLKFNKNSQWKGEVAHIDHIHPFTSKDSYPNGKENINEISNLQALCPECNLKKKDKRIN